jgi:hypothetical protein
MTRVPTMRNFVVLAPVQLSLEEFVMGIVGVYGGFGIHLLASLGMQKCFVETIKSRTNKIRGVFAKTVCNRRSSQSTIRFASKTIKAPNDHAGKSVTGTPAGTDAASAIEVSAFASL